MKLTRLVAVIVAAFTAPLFAGRGGTNELDQSQHAMHAQIPPRLVDLVRQATQPFRDAPPDGYGQFLGCVSGPEEGAMGVHFVNLALVGDGELDPNHPEALIYEPKDGRLTLVGVEYIVPVDLWNANPDHKGPPVLEGQLLQLVDSPNRFGLDPFYELHVWAWRENPNGAFVDWNPHVSCEGQ